MLYSQKMKRQTEKIMKTCKVKKRHEQPPPCLHMTVDIESGKMNMLYQSGVICVYVYGASDKEIELEKDEEVSIQDLHAASPIYLNLTLQSPFAYLIHRTELESFNHMICGFRKMLSL